MVHLDWEAWGTLEWDEYCCDISILSSNRAWCGISEMSLGPHFPFCPFSTGSSPPSGKYTVMWLSVSLGWSEHLHSLARVIGPRTVRDSSQSNQSLQAYSGWAPGEALSVLPNHSESTSQSTSAGLKSASGAVNFWGGKRRNNLKLPSTISLSILKGYLTFQNAFLYIPWEKCVLKWRLRLKSYENMLSSKNY